MGKLRDNNFFFSGGREWCPAEVFEYLREQSLLKGSYKKISWADPNNYRIDVC
jgi:hypothetical protein